MSEIKIAFVTGASGNLGQAIVHKLIGEGYRVYGTVVPNDPAVLDFKPGMFEKKVVDLLNETETADLVAAILKAEKEIDTAVLTVGGFAMGDIDATKTADIEKQYRLNFETAYNAARPIFTQMKKRGRGRIFIIGSRPGLEGKSAKGMVAYSLAKSLLFRVAELMNEEAKKTNVVVSVVVPSTIDTPQNRKSMPEADVDSWVSPEAIAEVISFYASEAANIIREPIIKVYNRS